MASIVMASIGASATVAQVRMSPRALPTARFPSIRRHRGSLRKRV